MIKKGCAGLVLTSRLVFTDEVIWRLLVSLPHGQSGSYARDRANRPQLIYEISSNIYSREIAALAQKPPRRVGCKSMTLHTTVSKLQSAQKELILRRSAILVLHSFCANPYFAYSAKRVNCTA